MTADPPKSRLHASTRSCTKARERRQPSTRQTSDQEADGLPPERPSISEKTETSSPAIAPIL